MGQNEDVRQLTTFRLLARTAVQYDRRHGNTGLDRFLKNPAYLFVILICTAATFGVFEVAAEADMLLVAVVTLLAQTVGAVLFFIDEKYDKGSIRAIMASYIFFYAYALLAQNDLAVTPWLMTSFLLFTFVSVGSGEAMLWIVLVFTMLGGAILNDLQEVDPELTGSEARIVLVAYLLLTLFAYLMDMTGRLIARQIDEQRDYLQASNARYNVILNSVKDGLIVTDSNGRVTFCNEEALEMLGTKMEDMIGVPLSAAYVLTDGKGKILLGNERPISRVLSTGETVIANQTTQERYFVKRKDHEFPVALSVTPVLVGSKIDGAIMLFRDMSLEEQINRTKTEFVSLASHQLRTPLNVVSWYAEKLLAQKHGELPERYRQYTEKIYESNRNLIALVGDLLNASRVELGKVKIKNEDVQVPEVIRQAIGEIAGGAEAKGVQLVDDTGLLANTVLKNSDQGLLLVVIQNLVSNALKYTNEGTITVRGSLIQQGEPLQDHPLRQTAPRDGLTLSVRDSGIGIPVEQQNRVFDKMFRAANAEKTDVAGTGLGLYLTQSFVQALGGTIWFTSSAGNGSTFFVFLPYEREPEEGEGQDG